MLSVGIAVLLVLVILGVFYALPESFSDQYAFSEVEEVVERVPESTTSSQERVTIPIRASRAGFSPSEVRVPRGAQVTLRLQSVDSLEHGFVLRAYDIEEVLVPREIIEVEFVAVRQGSFRFYSNVPSFPGAGQLEGLLIVE